MSTILLTFDVPVSPAFLLSSDHIEEGRIQGKQVAALLAEGGAVLGIVGPATDSISEQRLNGLKSTMPLNTRLLAVRGKWTEQSGYDAVAAWLRLSTSKQEPIALVACQNDFMALGAKKAFGEVATGDTKERLIRVPIIGCDGLPDSGQLWVKQGLLTATVANAQHNVSGRCGRMANGSSCVAGIERISIPADGAVLRPIVRSFG